MKYTPPFGPVWKKFKAAVFGTKKIEAERINKIVERYDRTNNERKLHGKPMRHMAWAWKIKKESGRKQWRK